MSENLALFQHELGGDRGGLRVEDFVVERLREAIRRGSLASGTLVPATDQLARSINANLNAVNRGLARLAAEGYLDRRRRAGTFVQLPDKQRKRIYILAGPDLKSECNHTSRFIVRVLEEELDRRGFEVRLLGDLNLIAKLDRSEQRMRYEQILTEFAAFPPSGFVSVYFTMERLVGLQKYFSLPRAAMALAESDDVVLNVGEMITRGVPFLREGGVKKLALFVHATYLRPNASLYQKFWRAIDANRMTCTEFVEIFETNSNLELEISAYQRARAVFAEWKSRKIPCDGLLVTDNVVMRGVAMALREARIRVPEDLRVLSFANKDSDLLYDLAVDRFEIPLAESAQGLADAIETRLTAPQVTVTPRIVNGVIRPYDETVQTAPPANDVTAAAF